MGGNGIVTYNPVLERYFLPLAWHNKIYDHGRYSRRSQVTMTFLSLLKPVGSLAAGLSYVLAINFPFKTMNLYMK